MKYDLSIRKQNIQPHLYLEQELQKQKNGLFTFVLRVNSGNIVDASILENVNVKRDYLTTTIIIEKLTVTSCDSLGGSEAPIRDANLQRGDTRGSRDNDNV